MSWEDLKKKLDLDYDQRMLEYEMQTEMLRIKREQFYRDNPDLPFKTMYMQVCAPPQRIIINIIK